MSKAKSFGITVRPRNGITNDTLDLCVEWLNKQDYAWGCIEVLNDDLSTRHLHAQIWLDEPRARGEVRRSIDRICERSTDWDSEQKKVLSKGIKMCYSDWYMDYMRGKDDFDESCIVADKTPANADSFYPSAEE